MQPHFSDKHNTLKRLDNFSLGQSDLPICKFSILQWLSSYPNTRTLKNLISPGITLPAWECKQYITFSYLILLGCEKAKTLPEYLHPLGYMKSAHQELSNEVLNVKIFFFYLRIFHFEMSHN